MALYDNKHWLLSHIRDSFISTDDTGLCEVVMAGDDIPKHLKKTFPTECYPEMDDSDDEDMDPMSESFDIRMDMEFGHRQRSNTALEQMDRERKKCAKIKHIKWEENSVKMTEEEKFEMFKRKDFKKKDSTGCKKQSLLSEQLEKAPKIPRNRFTEYAMFDGNGQFGVPVRKYRIFMMMLPEAERSYPIQIHVINTATVKQFIGLTLFKYATEHPNHNLKDDISKYGLYIGEDDGEVDWDLPSLDNREKITKFEFPTLCLVEITLKDRARHDPVGFFPRPVSEDIVRCKQTEQQILAEDLAKMQGHTTAMEAPLYQFYKAYILSKVRPKTAVQLGISGVTIEINTSNSEKSTSRFWHRLRAIIHDIDNIAACEITEAKGNKSYFTLVYTRQSNSSNSPIVSSPLRFSRSPSTFKSHDFEAETTIAEEIITKINNILRVRTSNARREFLDTDCKILKKKYFSLHR